MSSPALRHGRPAAPGTPTSSGNTASGNTAWWLLKETFNEWSEDKVPRLGAALAFYTALSIAPLVVLLLSIAAFFFGEEAARGQIQGQMQSLVGSQAAAAVEDIIAGGDEPKEGLIASVLGAITLLFGASGVFGQLQDSLNTVWDVRPKPGRGIWQVVRDRFFSFAMVLGIAFLLLVSLVISAALTAFGTLLDRLPAGLHFLSHAVHLGVSFVVFTLLFAAMFKWVPDVKIQWRDTWLGAAITAALFMLGKFAIGLYLGHSAMASSYGLAGSLVVLLVWVYYSSQILFLGAEFTQVYANRFGDRIEPTENAERISETLNAK